MMLLEELEAFKGGGGGGGGRGGSSRRKNKSELSKSINYFAAFAFLVVLFFLPAMFFNTKKK
jgi:hypothetical protein